MAINWTEGVFRNSTQTGTDLLLLLILADSADRDTGACYPGVKTLARLMRTSVRNVQLRLKALRDSGEISVQYQRSPFGTNLYVLNRSLLGGEAQFTPDAQPIERGEVEFTPGEAQVTGGGEAQFTGGVKHSSPKPLVEPSVRTRKKTNAKEPGDFAPWYALYPRKVSRQRAVRAWVALSPDDRAAAMAAVPHHAALFANREPDKIPHPATWLNDRRWEDQLPIPFRANGHAPKQFDQEDIANGRFTDQF
jgi:hypothetical protein